MRARTRLALSTFAVFAMFAVTAPATAQSPGYQAEIDAFFERFAAGERNEAIDKLYGKNPWIPLDGDGVRNIKAQLQGVGEVVGEYVGAVKVGELVVADRLVHVTYMALFERQPLRFEFEYYRARNEWMIFSFEFDGDIDDDLQAEARRLVVAGGGGR
ncbi:MAG TPA: hypothetical protein VMV46_16210 [Thermoanaerobaculia bacterium]|nr:hypothetical protein [Thermoanaerobaculia bacterium]